MCASSPSRYTALVRCSPCDLQRFPDATRAAQRMSEALALHYAAAALRCVGALHGCALLHGDLKPDNFLLAPRGGLQLIDFGRAVDLALLPDTTLFLVRRMAEVPVERVRVRADAQWTWRCCRTPRCSWYAAWQEGF